MKKIRYGKTCPFEVVDVNTKAKEWQGAANFIHKKTGECIALVHGHFVPDLKELMKMSESEQWAPCPFEIVDVISPGYEGFVNFIYIGTEQLGGYPIAFVHKNFAKDLREIVDMWDHQKERVTK